LLERLEKFLKSVKRFSGKNCSKNKGLEQLVEPSETKNALKSHYVIIILALMVAGMSVAFLLWNIRGNFDYIFSLRAGRLLALFLVGYTVAVSTVLFQTLTHNRILTPSIMGFEALYRLLHTFVVFFFGALPFINLGAITIFFMDTLLLCAFCSLLFRWLFVGLSKNLHLVLLVGVVCGLFFRSLTSLMQRMINPDDFVVLQHSFFANFNNYNGQVLVLAIGIVLIASVIIMRLLPVFDILALGREQAINLGLDYQNSVMLVLFLVSILVATSTALVGPVTFFGLLVANMAYQLSNSYRHAHRLPIAILLGILMLVGGQFILEHVFQYNAALPMIIEFCGGLVMIFLLKKGKIR